MIKTRTVNINFVERLKKMNVPHDIQTTSLTTKLICPYGTFFFSDGDIQESELFLIQMVMREVEQLPPIEFYKQTTYYFAFRRLTAGEIFTDYTELDINSAYWQTARNLNIISPELYERGKKVTKKTRLVSLGNLGKKKSNYTWNGKEYVFKGFEENEHTKKYWDLICSTLGNHMSEIFFQTDSLFYWVDAMFIHNSQREIFSKLAAERGYQFKEKELNKIVVGNKFIEVHDHKPKPRKFFLPDNNRNILLQLISKTL